MALSSVCISVLYGRFCAYSGVSIISGVRCSLSLFFYVFFLPPDSLACAAACLLIRPMMQSYVYLPFLVLAAVYTPLGCVLKNMEQKLGSCARSANGFPHFISKWEYAYVPFFFWIFLCFWISYRDMLFKYFEYRDHL